MIIVDTSVALKWVVREAGHEKALHALTVAERRTAPDLLLPEFTNILRKKLRSGQITIEQGQSAIVAIRAAFAYFVPATELAQDAFILADRLDHSAYDCFFLACAIGRGVLVSADEVFIRKCRDAGFASSVASLDDVLDDRFAARLAVAALEPAMFEKIERLSARIRATFSTLDELEAKTSGDFKIVPLTAGAGAFSSPAYRRLEGELRSLSNDDLAIIVALGWLGRGYDGGPDRWESLLSRARELTSPGFDTHSRYIIAQMGSVKSGLAKLQVRTSG